MTVLVIINPAGCVLMRRRSERLLRGMWVFELTEGALTAAEAAEHVNRMGLTAATPVMEIGCAAHIFTHRLWRMNGYAVPVCENVAPEGFDFVSQDGMRQLALTAALRFYTDWFLQKGTL